MTDVAPRVVGAPIPAGRGRWRIALAERSFVTARGNIIAEITGARSRRLEQQLNGAATFSFAIDGRSQTALALRELAHEILVWRWDEAQNFNDRPMFRGVITQTQDTLSEQRHTVTVTAHDHLALLARRYNTTRYQTTADQDAIVNAILGWGGQSSSGVWFAGTYRPMIPNRADPAGNNRPGNSGRVRVRDYPASTSALDALDNLANVIDGFDYNAIPSPQAAGGGAPDFTAQDNLNIYYPYRGIARYDWGFVYGSTVSSLSRSLNSTNYANYVRTVGQSDEGQPQLYAEAWTDDALDTITNPAGLWMTSSNASDVTEVATLAEKALGMLDDMGVLVPSYSLSLRPGVWRPGLFDLGDTVTLRIRSGRLDVNTWVRVVAQTFVIGDDGQEDVEVDVGRPSATFFNLLTAADRRLSALERR